LSTVRIAFANLSGVNGFGKHASVRSLVAGRNGSPIAHFLGKPKRRIVVRLAAFAWTREDFCRGWLITGDTGSGKTARST
jgi:hypothetical protein